MKQLAVYILAISSLCDKEPHHHAVLIKRVYCPVLPLFLDGVIRPLTIFSLSAFLLGTIAPPIANSAGVFNHAS